jgi:hypothetical protein
MKYMLMMHAPRGTGDYDVGQWPKADFKAMIEFQMRFDRELKERGELVADAGLAPPGQARLVRAGKTGKPIVTDGPFPEAKEYLAGYWIVDVDSPERAYEIAAQASAVPGPGGVPLNIPVEVRQVMSGPPPVD